MMVNEINFVPVLNAMVEPELKLIVTCAAARASMVLNYIPVYPLDPR